MSKASGDDLASLYSVYLKPTSGGTAARGARGNGAAWSSTDSSLSDSCTAIDISSDNIHDVANYETGGERKEETVGDQQQEREGEATWERNEREEKDEEDEAQEEGEGYVTAEEWDSGGEEGEESGKQWEMVAVDFIPATWIFPVTPPRLLISNPNLFSSSARCGNDKPWCACHGRHNASRRDHSAAP